jgi:ELWxxDGT repeat protein
MEPVMKDLLAKRVLCLFLFSSPVFILFSVFFIVNASPSVIYHPGPHQVKDISQGTQSSNPTDLIDVNGTLYFQATDGEYGHELWKSDGTNSGTVSIKHFGAAAYHSATPMPAQNPPEPNFYPRLQSLVAVDDIIYFVYDYHLWRSDGTESGTYGLDATPGTPSNLTKGDGLLFYTREDFLWRSDGTTAGTFWVNETRTGPRNLAWVNDSLYFSGEGAGMTHGNELWQSDGTAVGTVLLKDIYAGSSSSNPAEFVGLNGFTYFAATDNLGRELWRSDGTGAGTTRVTDILTGTASANPAKLTVMGGLIYFSANGGQGVELWRSDGTAAGTEMVKDVRTSGDANPTHLTVMGDQLFFAAQDGVHGAELWMSDGTEAGTKMVTDIRPGAVGALPDKLTVVGDALFFTADDGVHGRELWQSDGTAAGTFLVKDLQVGSAAEDLDYLTAVNDILYFRASYELYGKELWRSDGTAAGTIPVKDVNTVPETAYPDEFSSMGDAFYFRAHDKIHGYELWQSDGSEAGTTLVKDIFPGYSASYPHNFTDLGNTLLFKANDGVHGLELWRSDGTENGTFMVKDISTGDTFNPYSLTSPLFVKDGIVYLAVDDNIHGLEPWRSDGTAEGTVLIKNIQAGDSLIGSTQFVEINDTIVFSANDGTGRELWQTDGTETGTTMIVNINPAGSGFVGSTIEVMADVGYFVGNNGADGRELWRTDGSANGTVMVKNINATGDGIPNYRNFTLTVIDDIGYFLADDGEHGTELWRTDGTAGGTNMVVDLTENGSSNIISLFSFNGALFFSTIVYDGVNRDYALWYSDGTEAGTIQISDKFVNTYVKGENMIYFTSWATSDLWQSDGTLAGTQLVKTFDTSVWLLSTLHDRLIFAVGEYTQAELWQTDGTEDSTQRVDGIPEGAYFPLMERPFFFNETLFFPLEMAPSQLEFWSLGNTLPVAQPDSVTMASGSGSVLIYVLDNDTDFNNQDNLHISSLSTAAHGTAVIEGTAVRYTPDSGFIGTEELVYIAADDFGGTDEATITITIEDYHLYFPLLMKPGS